MNGNRNDLFASANQELRAFLSRAENVVQGTGDIGAEDLRALGQLLDRMAPEMAEDPRKVPGDAIVQEEVQRYVSNLRSVQVSLEQIRCVMLARLAALDATRRHVEGFHDWANAYQQTA